MAKYQSQSEPEPEIPGLPESIRMLLASVVSYLHARLELFSLEFKDAGVNYLKIAIVLVCAVVTLVFGLVFLVLSAVYLVAYLCSFHWGWVFFGFGFLMLIFSVVCLLIAKARFGLASFATTISELKKDKEWLSQTKSANRTQTLSVVRTN